MPPETSLGQVGHGNPHSPENDPDWITCPTCGEDTWDDGTPCVECANGELREPRSFAGRTAFPVERAA